MDGDTDEVISSATVKCETKTGASNPATFTGLSFGTYNVSASANGCGSASGSASVSASSPSKSVTLKLYKQAGSVTVTVRDSETRHTIAGAYVSGAGKSGTTDSSGRISFSGIDFGTYTFTASADGYSSNTGSATMTESSTSASITIYLDPEAESGSGLYGTTKERNAEMAESTPVRIFTVDDGFGNKVRLAPVLGLYEVQDFMGQSLPGIAIMLDEYSEDNELIGPYADLTVSFGEFIGMKNCAYIDTNDCSFADQIMKEIGTDTGFTRRSGFCQYPAWVINEDFLTEIDPETYQEYSDACDEYMNSILDPDEDEGEDEDEGIGGLAL